LTLDRNTTRFFQLVVVADKNERLKFFSACPAAAGPPQNLSIMSRVLIMLGVLLLEKRVR